MCGSEGKHGTGVMALVTSKGTMDKTNSSVRKYIAQRADLLGAIRFPNNTFKDNAGTEVVYPLMECKTVWKSTPIRFSRAGKKPENENRKIIYDTLYDREKNLAFQKALNQAKEIFNICPICKRLVCDHCFLICDDLDMCVQCAAKLNEKGTVVG